MVPWAAGISNECLGILHRKEVSGVAPSMGPVPSNRGAGAVAWLRWELVESQECVFLSCLTLLLVHLSKKEMRVSVPWKGTEQTMQTQVIPAILSGDRGDS